jgi:hypothetical protein
MDFGDAASALLCRRSAFSIGADLREAVAAGATWAADMSVVPLAVAMA